MNYILPTSVEVGGTEYKIRTDFRAVLDILEAMEDQNLSEPEKIEVMLQIFYFSPDYTEIPTDYLQEAVDKCAWFIDCGEEPRGETKQPKVMDWTQDFPYIAAPVNRVLGKDVRGIDYNPETNEGGLHWWTFISAYNEIGGDCTYAQIVRIRTQKAKGKKLDKSDQEWYRLNRHLVDFKRPYTDKENAVLDRWGIKQKRTT